MFNGTSRNVTFSADRVTGRPPEGGIHLSLVTKTVKYIHAQAHLLCRCRKQTIQPFRNSDPLTEIRKPHYLSPGESDGGFAVIWSSKLEVEMQVEESACEGRLRRALRLLLGWMWVRAQVERSTGGYVGQIIEHNKEKFLPSALLLSIVLQDSYPSTQYLSTMSSTSYKKSNVDIYAIDRYSS